MEELTKKNMAGDIFRKFGIVIALAILFIVFSAITNAFFTPANLLTILVQTSINILLAIATTFIVLTGGIDLSSGSVLAIAGVVFAMFAKEVDGVPEYPVVVPVVMGILVGLLFGLFNGVIVAKAKVAPFIVTLGTMTIARGAALLLADGRPVSGMAQGFKDFAGKSPLGLPNIVIVMIIMAVIFTFILTKTKFGRYVYAIGGNEEAARASGIATSNIKLVVYTMAGAIIGLAGVLQACRINVGQPNVGQGYEMNAISAVVIGGTSLSGGVGSMWGTLIGAFIIGILNNGLDMLGVSSYWQQVVSGAIIIGAVMMDRTNKK
ncbi:ABC transporter permease [Christensenellaceae bacterium OttesenSCG-928-K19]|nr:ABC transporter permease [Christensenellaceae bacterium OttesenSCG-928-K19]